ncbi:MAG: hypothetical protein A3I22_00235 [Parcubacteria group bacterium RIFCSPLOWO2_02_FULL_40_12]|nr:MAG: hypothetical protein A3I22_00235 [Parcubacteria group bacterium RIFCSPLOWO2_02_FULL_40_12]
MRRHIHAKISSGEGGLYLVLMFPVTVAFLLTFTLSRVVSYFVPWLYLLDVGGQRVHHFAYGILVLAAAGYLALTFSGPRAKYLISLFYGFGLGLAFDEFGMWLRLRDDDPIRWSYDGFLTVIGTFFFVISAKTGIKLFKKLWPFGPKSGPPTSLTF